MAVNTGAQPRTLRIPVWQIGAEDGDQMSRQMMTYEEGYNAGRVDYEVKDGMLEVEVPPVGSVVLGL